MTNENNKEIKKALIEQVKRLRTLGLDRTGLVPITTDSAKKPPSWFPWTEYRDEKRPPLNDNEIEEIWSKPDVARGAIMLNGTCFLIDVDCEGLAVQRILERRMSEKLQEHLRRTRVSHTPHGIHILVYLDPRAFPEGVAEMLCWQIIGRNKDGTNTNKRRQDRGHADGSGEIRILSQVKYAIEAGEGYGPIDAEHEKPAVLDEELSRELVELYTSFKDQSNAIRMMMDGNKKESILEYWTAESGRRQDIAMGLAGTCWHTKVPEALAYDLVYYIAKVSNDEELDLRLSAVRDTYRNGRAGKDIAGRSKLLPALDGNTEIIARIHQGLEGLGYKITRSNVIFKGSDASKKFFGSVDDIKGKEGDPNTREGFGGALGSKADIAVELCSEFIIDLFVDKFDVAFAIIEINNRQETIGIKRNKFKLFMRKVFYDSEGEALSQQALDSAVGVFESKAVYSDKKRLLALRISDGLTDISETAEDVTSQQIVSNEPLRIYYDLTNSKYQIVEVTPDNGWSIKDSNQVPQMFYRLQGQLPQATPTKSYPEDIMDQFMDLVNTVVRDANGNELVEETRKMRLLLKCYIIALFVPNIGRVILLLYGEQGSAKTAFLELVKMLVDPSGAPTLSFPRSIAEVVQQLSHNFIAYYDNVSIVKDWLSDALCRAATGTGFTKRQLYTDDEDIIYEFIRSAGISAIHLPGSKPDMLDRSLIAKFSFIQKDFRRKYKEDILPVFYQLRPQLLGYIFDILAQTLKIKSQGGIQLDTRSRMADWEEWCEIIARCMGYKPMEFINAYTANTKLQSDLVLEDRPVARAIVRLVQSLEEGDEWTGYTSTLLKELEVIATRDLDINIKQERLWPKAANALGYRIGEVKPNLRELDIEIYDHKDSSGLKVLHIGRKKDVCKRSQGSQGSPGDSKLEDFEHVNSPSKTGSDQITGDTGDAGDFGDAIQTSTNEGGSG